jgi:hypothetical protein
VRASPAGSVADAGLSRMVVATGALLAAGPVTPGVGQLAALALAAPNSAALATRDPGTTSTARLRRLAGFMGKGFLRS